MVSKDLLLHFLFPKKTVECMLVIYRKESLLNFVKIMNKYITPSLIWKKTAWRVHARVILSNHMVIVLRIN